MKGFKLVNKKNEPFYGNIGSYKVGEIYTHSGELKLCESGFHFGLNIPECLHYTILYNYDPEIYNVLEISAIGRIFETKGDKYVTSKIYIEKLLSEDEVYKLCTGRFELYNHTVYFKDGKRHREDGPAIEYSNGNKEWLIDGKYHREDGRPAIEYDDGGTKLWYKDGKQHRENGPAVEYANGNKEWWINGKQHREDDRSAIEHANGDRMWCKYGKIHRKEGPAIKYANGDTEWLVDGKYHREDGPAIEFANGDKSWCINGKLHREDGPAIEFAYGDKYWWINGVEMSQDEFEIQYPNQKDNNNINKCEYPGCNIYIINSTKCYEHYFV